MANSPIYRVAFRRRREGKTDYARRLAAVRSGKTRLVVRKSNASVYAQLIEFRPEGDLTLSSATGAELRGLGWKGGLGNLPAAYLVGYLLAKKAGKGEAILDIGMQRPAKGGRLFAVLKGAVDGGLEVPCDESAFPSPERIDGSHIKGAPSTFSEYKKRGCSPDQVPDNFKQVKEKIEKTIGGK
jgi:large subunit ribosomal protein L18